MGPVSRTSTLLCPLNEFPSELTYRLGFCPMIVAVAPALASLLSLLHIARIQHVIRVSDALYFCDR